MKLQDSGRPESSAPMRIENRTLTLGGMASGKQSIFSRIRSLRGSGSKGSALVEMALSLPRVRSESEGSALVEMSVTLPLMMLIMTGIFSLSIALLQKLQLAEAVSAGGRVLSAQLGQTDPCAATASAIWAAAPGLTKSSLKMTFILNGRTVVNAQTGSAVTCAGDGGSPYMVETQSAEVLATYSVGVGIYGAAWVTIPLASQVTEAVQ